MGKQNDIASLKARVKISDVISGYVKLQGYGGEHKGLCPFHNEKTPSFTVSDDKGFYQCFGCGAHGDHLDFLMEHDGLTLQQAKERLEKLAGVSPVKENKKLNSEIWQPLRVTTEKPPIEDGKWKVWNPKRNKGEGQYSYLRPDAVFEYRSIEGKLHGFVLRCSLPGGKKWTPTVTYCVNKEREKRWCLVSFGKPRPIYGAQHIRDDNNIIVVEGEKCADRLQPLTDDAVIAWPQGTNSIHLVDWSPLKDRNITIWPDSDDVGYNAALGYEGVKGRKDGLVDLIDSKYISIIPRQEDKPKGWDCADVADDDEVLRCLALAEPLHDEPEPVQEEIPEYATEEIPIEITEYGAEINEATLPPVDIIESDDQPFKVLGFDGKNIFFVTASGKQVLDFTCTDLCSVNTLIALAPLQWWEREFSGGEGFNAAMAKRAANKYIYLARKMGIFKLDNLRGRGVWWDDKRTVIHAGGHLFVDGNKAELGHIKSKKIYQNMSSIDISPDDPLPVEKSKKLIAITESLFWNTQTNAALLAGWIALAPICGALNWRPHIYITAEAGSGKSWVLNNIIMRCLEGIAINPESSATEAGIRQKLECDALPVVFDEAEAETIKAQKNLENILGLARQSSSSGGGQIIKGTAAGKSQTFDINSMFCFSSIGVPIKQHSDQTRISVLTLVKDNTAAGQDHFKSVISPLVVDTLTDDYIKRLHARSCVMVSKIRENAKTFSDVAGRVLLSKRLGDQIGSLLAGYYSLLSDDVIGAEQARVIINSYKWGHLLPTEEDRDDVKLLENLLQTNRRLPIEQKDSYGQITTRTVDRSIAQLVAIASRREEDVIALGDADTHLQRCGLRVKDDYLMIANRHKELEIILANTAFSINWGRILERHEGAERSENAWYFASVRSRGIKIPLKSIFCD